MGLLLFFFALCFIIFRETEPFEDEIHPRLRFAHRGLVGMANNGSKNSNDSQFFITLGAFVSGVRLLTRTQHTRMAVDRADELQGKHTLFGRCVGDTIYSVSSHSWDHYNTDH